MDRVALLSLRYFPAQLSSKEAAWLLGAVQRGEGGQDGDTNREEGLVSHPRSVRQPRAGREPSPCACGLPRLLTLNQVAAHLGVTRRQVERLVSAHRIKALRAGTRTVRISELDLAKFIERNTR